MIEKVQLALYVGQRNFIQRSVHMGIGKLWTFYSLKNLWVYMRNIVRNDKRYLKLAEQAIMWKALRRSAKRIEPKGFEDEDDFYVEVGKPEKDE